MKRILSLAIVVLSIFAFGGCAKKTPNVPVKDIVESIKNQMTEDMKAAGAPEESFKDGKLPGFMEIDLTSEETEPFAKPVKEKYNMEDLEEGIVLQQMMSVKSDLIIVLKAKDESKVENLKAVLEKEKEQQEKIWSQYLPDQYEKVKNNIIKVKGNYLIYITYENPEKIEAIFDNALK
ncbi:DUF4358 domain-containing protein [Clostridium ganghwense]|uniref:DUF4358 domain-containing protein n=1 Tax=Clostridium ganghwense TaxID=312089 RepID=A0ABT4CPC5_9CLOT|nr:DUF4358 domain-containing protein [Clostridium ganghwense]MCY6370091.1 DUF4358 domain-containing protein [Clostridium ganghwense]